MFMCYGSGNEGTGDPAAVGVACHQICLLLVAAASTQCAHSCLPCAPEAHRNIPKTPISKALTPTCRRTTGRAASYAGCPAAM